MFSESDQTEMKMLKIDCLLFINGIFISGLSKNVRIMPLKIETNFPLTVLISERDANRNMKIYEQVAEETKGTATLAFVNWYVQTVSFYKHSNRRNHSPDLNSV